LQLTNLSANYGYDLLNHLTGVTMPRSTGTQTRTFVYNGPYLMSTTNPENGTVNYTYNADGTLATKIDAKGQKTGYTYNANMQVTQIQRYPLGTVEDTAQRTTFTYGSTGYSQYAYGRLSSVQYSGTTVPLTFNETYSYTQGGLMTKKWLQQANFGLSLETFQTYDNEGKVLTVKYPDVYDIYLQTTLTGRTYTYTYDNLGRPVGLTDNRPTPVTWVNNVQYGPADELRQISYQSAGYTDDELSGYGLNTETRTYNSRLQLTNINLPTFSAEYRYSPTQNNGQITQQVSGGEEVTYTYDSLNRLIAAVTTGPQWGQSFTYDGFGNRTGATVTKGTAPFGSWSVDAATNRVMGYSYDANGNMLSAPNISGSLTYDVENRLTSAGGESYAYAPDNRRVWRTGPGNASQDLYFYGISGQRLGVYRVAQYVSPSFDVNLYFGSRMIVSRGVNAYAGPAGVESHGRVEVLPVWGRAAGHWAGSG